MKMAVYSAETAAHRGPSQVPLLGSALPLISNQFSTEEMWPSSPCVNY